MLRILQGVETDVLVKAMERILADQRSRTVGARGIELLEELFGNRGSEGAIMAARATQPLMDEVQVRLSCEVLAGDLLAALRTDA